MAVHAIIDIGRQPDRETLLALYGSDEPIGYFALRRYENALDSIYKISDLHQTAAAYAKAIVDYAIDLRKEQANYSDISPYGGLDIDVEPIDKIALREVESGSYMYNEVGPLIIQELVNRHIALDFCREKVKVFESMKSELSGRLQAAYDKWVQEDKKLYEEIAEAVDLRNRAGHTLYNQSLALEESFKCKPWFYRVSHSKEYENIQKQKESALAMVGTSVDSPEIRAKFGFRVDKHLEATPVVGRFNGVETDYAYINSEEALCKAIAEAQEYCNNSQNIEVYKIARDALKYAEKCKTVSNVIDSDISSR